MQNIKRPNQYKVDSFGGRSFRSVTSFVSMKTIKCCQIGKMESYSFIFGYGSLVNRQSRASSSTPDTFMHDAIPATVVPSDRLSLRRMWNFRSAKGGFTALGLRIMDTKEDGIPINGVIYPVATADLPELKRREVGYDMHELSRLDVVMDGWQVLPNDARIYVFVPQPRFDALPDAEFPMLQSYIDICILGFLDYGKDYARRFIESTDGWSHHWLDDRLLPRRPWVYQPKWGVVDEMLQSTPKSTSSFEARQMPVFYTPQHDQRLRHLEEQVQQLQRFVHTSDGAVKVAHPPMRHYRIRCVVVPTSHDDEARTNLGVSGCLFVLT